MSFLTQIWSPDEMPPFLKHTPGLGPRLVERWALGFRNLRIPFAEDPDEHVLYM